MILFNYSNGVTYCAGCGAGVNSHSWPLVGASMLTLVVDGGMLKMVNTGVVAMQDKIFRVIYYRCKIHIVNLTARIVLYHS